MRFFNFLFGWLRKPEAVVAEAPVAPVDETCSFCSCTPCILEQEPTSPSPEPPQTPALWSLGEQVRLADASQYVAEGAVNSRTPTPILNPLNHDQLRAGLESMFTLNKIGIGYGDETQAAFAEIADPPKDYYDGIECETCDVQSETPVLFRGELFKIKRSLNRIKFVLEVSGFPEQQQHVDKVNKAVDALVDFVKNEPNLRPVSWWEGPSTQVEKQAAGTTAVECPSTPKGF